jgi:2,4-dienoyl-CoA reductase-like NADH-dependent reductase (Old Yellow Enzyme family)
MKVFEKAVIAGVEFNNRIIRSATHEGTGGPDGSALPAHAAYIERLAKGGAGGIISGNLGVGSAGRSISNMAMIDSDERISGLRAAADAAKKYNTPIFAQLNHGGAQCVRKVTGSDPVAPSKCRGAMASEYARELRDVEIIDVIKSFVQAVVRARTAGFSGVQLHAAHGYLLSEFLSPAVNRRSDRWGGSTVNRFRIIAEIISRAREQVGSFPIMAKFSSYDGDPGGMTLDEGVRIAQLFQEAGCDALEISCGGMRDGFNSMRVPKIPVEALIKFTPLLKRAGSVKKFLTRKLLPLIVKRPEPLYMFNAHAGEKIKRNVDIPVITVGGFRELADIESFIADGKSDFVSMSRPFIIEPDIVNKFISGKQTVSKCIDCGYCLFGCIAAPLKCYYGKVK